MLKKEETLVTNLSWNFPLFHNFNVVITNGKLTSLVMPEDNHDGNIGLVTTNEEYIKNLHKALGDVINEINHQKEFRDKKEFFAKMNTDEKEETEA